MPDQAGDVVAAMRPGRRQIFAEQRIKDEQDGDDRHDRAGGPARRFQHQHNKGDAEDHVPSFGHRGAVGEIVAAPKCVAHDADGEQTGEYIEPLNAIAEAGGHREQQETQHQHESQMGVAQRLRGDDVVGGIEVKQGHRHGDAGDGYCRPSGEAVAGALFLLDVFFRLAQSIRGNFGIGIQFDVARHFPPMAAGALRLTGPLRCRILTRLSTVQQTAAAHP